MVFSRSLRCTVTPHEVSKSLDNLCADYAHTFRFLAGSVDLQAVSLSFLPQRHGVFDLLRSRRHTTSRARDQLAERLVRSASLLSLKTNI